MKLKFAFAVDNKGNFKDDHFGEADKYIIYEENEGDLVRISEELNTKKDMDESHQHGLKKKGNSISRLLKEKGVNVLVTKQFGKNLDIVSMHFIPVLVSSERPDEAFEIIKKNLFWLRDEWKRDTERYNLFSMKSGLMKTAVKTRK